MAGGSKALNHPPPRMPYDIFCFIPGNRSTFPVSINETESVDNLRDKIKPRTVTS